MGWKNTEYKEEFCSRSDFMLKKVIDGKRAGMKTLSVHGATGADVSVEDLSENIFAILNK